MVQKRAYRPRLEECLEDRITPVAAATASMVAMPSAHTRQLHIMGLIQGTSQSPAHQIPDVGTELTLHGTGQLTSVGRVSVSGNLHMAGFILVGRDQGMLTLSNRHGSVILKLERTVDNRMQTPPADPPYTFSIVGASGNFRGAKGTGTAEIEFGGPIRLVPAPQGGNFAVGSFLLALNEPFPPVAIPL